MGASTSCLALMRRSRKRQSSNARSVRVRATWIAAADVCSAPVAKPAASPAVSPATSPAAAATLSIDQLSAIQPGLGTVMIEYAGRMGHLWFAGEAENWDFAQYS